LFERLPARDSTHGGEEGAELERVRLRVRVAQEAKREVKAKGVKAPGRVKMVAFYLSFKLYLQLHHSGLHGYGQRVARDGVVGIGLKRNGLQGGGVNGMGLHGSRL
jgi:hypothetical protein